MTNRIRVPVARRRLAGFVAVLAGLGFMGGCGSTTASSGPTKTAGGLITVRIGTQPYYDYQFFKVAHALGIDKEFGLNLVDVPEPGQTAYPQLARGDIDIAASCESCMLPAIANLPQLRDFLITELFKGFVLIGRSSNGTPDRKPYADFLQADGGDRQRAAASFVATLRGASFAINPAADGALLGALLEHADLTPKDVKIISFPDEGKAALAFISGAGDYYFGSLPQEVRMLTSPDLKKNFVEAGPAELFPVDYANFAAMSSWLGSHEEVAVRLVAVWFRVTRYLQQRPDEVVSIIAKQLQSQTGGLLTNQQTKVVLTKFLYFAPFDRAYTTYFDPQSPMWEGGPLKELYQQATSLKQIPPGTNFAQYEVAAKYFNLLRKQPDLVKKIEAPLQ